MSIDVVKIWNLALSEVAAEATVSSQTENSIEANLCSLWYEIVLENVLAAAPWPSITTHQRLAVLKKRDSTADWVSSDPAPGWVYAYAAPADMVIPQRLFTYARFDWGNYSGSPAIFANQEDAILFYNRNETDPSKWDVALRQTVIYSLAAALAYKLSGKQNLAQRLEDKAYSAILNARTSVANAQNDERVTMPEWIQARDFDPVPISDRYSYPMRSINIVGA